MKPNLLIIYYSRGGNTKAMAEIIAEAATSAGAKTTLKTVEETTQDDLFAADAIIAGSPTYYGSMAGEMKLLFDRSIANHGKLEGKVGAAFSSAANIGGGNETTVMDILKVFLIHGMVVRGSSKGDHYGPIAIGAPDERASKQCRALGARVAELAARLGKEGA